MLDARKEYLEYFKENPDAFKKKCEFWFLNKYEWYLL